MSPNLNHARVNGPGPAGPGLRLVRTGSEHGQVHVSSYYVTHVTIFKFKLMAFKFMSWNAGAASAG